MWFNSWFMQLGALAPFFFFNWEILKYNTMNEEKFIDVNGFQVMDLAPDMQRKLALVDLDVLVEITNSLQKVNSRIIKQDLIAELQCVTNNGELTRMQQLLYICEKFVTLHKTVLKIQNIEHPLNEKAVADLNPIKGKDISDIS